MKQLQKKACKKGDQLSHFLHPIDLIMTFFCLNWIMSQTFWVMLETIRLIFTCLHLPSPSLTVHITPRTQVLQWMPVDTTCFDSEEVSSILEDSGSHWNGSCQWRSWDVPTLRRINMSSTEWPFFSLWPYVCWATMWFSLFSNCSLHLDL